MRAEVFEINLQHFAKLKIFGERKNNYRCVRAREHDITKTQRATGMKFGICPSHRNCRCA